MGWGVEWSCGLGWGWGVVGWAWLGWAWLGLAGLLLKVMERVRTQVGVMWGKG